MTARPRLASGAMLMLAAAALPLGACDRAVPPPPGATAASGAAAGPTAAAVVPEQAAPDAPQRSDSEPQPAPREIYYDLTAYDWYRQGQPLVHDGLQYRAEGRPRALPAAGLRLLGRYEGVDYYVGEADPPPFAMVYVPVFEGFWQPFVTQVPAPAEPQPAVEEQAAARGGASPTTAGRPSLALRSAGPRLAAAPPDAVR